MIFDALNFMHLLFFVYWLGGDLGTYYSSKFVSNATLSVPARVTALKIMAGVDMGPRICMPMIFAFGVHLAYLMDGLDISALTLALVWLVSLVWLGLVFAVHHEAGMSSTGKFARFDFYFRIVVIVIMVATAVYGLATGGIVKYNWVAVKLLVMAVLVAFGLMIRVNLTKFTPAFTKLVTSGPSDEVNKAITASIRGSLPWVYLIWLGVLVNTAIGVNLFNLFRG